MLFWLHTRKYNIDFQSSISCMQHFSTIISIDLDIHETTGRFGLTYTVNMVFKSDSINPCMHTKLTINGLSELTFHVKYESFCFFFLRKTVVNMTNDSLWSVVYVAMCNSCMHNVPSLPF